MIIFPAIDIRGGRCVRLTEGRFDQETVFADDPSEMAARWSVAGAEYLHVVDLDGALAGTGRNLPAIKKILEHASMPVQVGGGIRSLAAVAELLELGVSRVILGSAAVREPQLVAEACREFPGQVVVGIHWGFVVAFPVGGIFTHLELFDTLHQVAKVLLKPTAEIDALIRFIEYRQVQPTAVVFDCLVRGFHDFLLGFVHSMFLLYTH